MHKIKFENIDEIIDKYSNYLEAANEDNDQKRISQYTAIVNTLKRIQSNGGRNVNSLDDYFKLIHWVSQLTEGEFTIKNDGQTIELGE
jgi:hypothetical protein